MNLFFHLLACVLGTMVILLAAFAGVEYRSDPRRFHIGVAASANAALTAAATNWIAGGKIPATDPWAWISVASFAATIVAVVLLVRRRRRSP